MSVLSDNMYGIQDISNGQATDTDEETGEEIWIERRLAYADPGRDTSNPTIFIPCTYTSTKHI
jgi:hypothetical protein